MDEYHIQEHKRLESTGSLLSLSAVARRAARKEWAKGMGQGSKEWGPRNGVQGMGSKESVSPCRRAESADGKCFNPY